jgi:hypothetical protein
MKIKKIIVNKSDEAAEVVEKIMDAEAEEIILNVPRFSKLAESLANFHLIKRESEFLNKKIIIESVDDKAIELAGLAKLESLNPFFTKSQRISDIVMRREIVKKGAAEIKAAPEPHRKKSRPGRRPPAPFKIASLLLFAVLAAAMLFVAVRVLPRAAITLVSQKDGWNYNDSVIVDKMAVKADENSMKLPGQIFTQSRNLQLVFKASGKKTVEKKASGKAIIYNAYSSEPQPLVATTRLVTPDGKIFRLKNNITVPGAKIAEGKIVSSSIETEIIADKVGEAYNIGPVPRFAIPGFKGTPKFGAFYAESKEAMSGGFIGDVAFPTDSDLKKAKQELENKLTDSLIIALTTQIPPEFKLIPGAKEIVFVKNEISEEIDAGGNFGIFGEAVGTAILFKEADFLTMLKGRMQKELGDVWDIKDFSLEYGEARVDFQRGRMSFPVKFKSLAAHKIDVTDLKSRIMNKSEADLRPLILSIPGLESARISLWPFWVNRVPRNPNKIKIAIE